MPYVAEVISVSSVILLDDDDNEAVREDEEEEDLLSPSCTSDTELRALQPPSQQS